MKSHQGWVKPLKSSFFVKTSLTAAQLRDGIKEHIDVHDDIVVVTVTGASWTTYGISSTVADWMKRNLQCPAQSSVHRVRGEQPRDVSRRRGNPSSSHRVCPCGNVR